MPKSRPPYPAEFRRPMIELVRIGRDPNDLAREFEPSAQAIRNWVAEDDRSEGRRDAKPPPADPGLTTVERDELVRLRRENRQLKLEREPKISEANILSRATHGGRSPAQANPRRPLGSPPRSGVRGSSADGVTDQSTREIRAASQDPRER